jgi:hypothetical protein
MWFNRILPGLIVLLFIVLLINTARQNAPVWHESSQLLAGLNIWKFKRFDTQEVNPPLERVVVAFPVLFFSLNLNEKIFDRSPIGREEFAMGSTFLEKNSYNNRILIFVARLAGITFSIVGIIFCYIFAKELYGNISGLIVLLMICFSPFFLGHGATIINDVPTAFMGIIAVFFFKRWLKQPEFAEALTAGIFLGFAILSKFTLLIFYPLFFVLWIFYQNPVLGFNKRKDYCRQLGGLCVLYIAGIFVINLGYLGIGTFAPLEYFRFKSIMLTGKTVTESISSESSNRFENSLLGKIPMPLPANFIQGIDTQRLDFERGFPSYLRGEWSDHGWWYYYLYALFLKTPLGTIGLFLLTIFCTLFQKGYNISWRDEMVIILPGIVLLAFVSSQTGFSVHSRYAIPVLPFFFIWIAKVGRALSLKRPVIATLASILLVWSIFNSLWIYPHSISYFNELAAILPTPEDKNYPKPIETSPKTFWQKTKRIFDCGSRNGARHLLDSNIDWGQDLFYLEKWYKKHPEAKDIKVACWGNYPLELTIIPLKKTPPVNHPQPGWYVLSVNYIYDREKQYRYFLNFEPVATAGYSIYIYHITQDDVNKLYREKDLP